MSSRELPNYFAWFLMKKFSPVLPDDYFAHYYFNIRARDLGKKGKEKWRACLLETEKTMPLSIGMMFAKDVITPLAANKVLLGSKSSYFSIVGSTDWRFFISFYTINRFFI